MPWSGSTSQWPAKYVKMDPEVKRRFETAARALGMRESEVVDQLVRTWLGQVESQIRLSRFFDQPQSLVIHADRVEIAANKALLFNLKTELTTIIQTLKLPDSQRVSDNFFGAPYEADHTLAKKQFRANLERVLRRARGLPGELRAADKELQDLVAEAEAYISMELRQ